MMSLTIRILSEIAFTLIIWGIASSFFGFTIYLVLPTVFNVNPDKSKKYAIYFVRFLLPVLIIINIIDFFRVLFKWKLKETNITVGNMMSQIASQENELRDWKIKLIVEIQQQLLKIWKNKKWGRFLPHLHILDKNVI